MKVGRIYCERMRRREAFEKGSGAFVTTSAFAQALSSGPLFRMLSHLFRLCVPSKGHRNGNIGVGKLPARLRSAAELGQTSTFVA